MTDFITVTLNVTAILEKMDIQYFIGGSLAGILYGEYRTTNDVDIVASIQKSHIPDLMKYLSSDFYIHATEIEMAITDQKVSIKNSLIRPSFNIIHHETGFKLIFFFQHNVYLSNQNSNAVSKNHLPNLLINKRS